MMALIWYVTSSDPNVELVHGECLSVYQTFHCFMRSFMVDAVGSLMTTTRETTETYLHVM